MKAIFNDPVFCHHAPLPGGIQCSDEGAANHTRLCTEHAGSGIHLFVYGKDNSTPAAAGASAFPARQSLAASQAVARLHQLHADRVVYGRQHPDLIQAGVFHNDLIAVGNGPVLLYHGQAFIDTPRLMAEMEDKFIRACGRPPLLVKVDQITVEDAVTSYLFNSQLVTLPDDTQCLIAPLECNENPAIHALLEQYTGTGQPFQHVHFVQLRESMKNGGGPACLRLRVVLTAAELERIHPGVRLTDQRYAALTAWVHRFYRDRLQPQDLSDPLLLEECRSALDALTSILQLGPIYRFQRG